MAALRRRDRSTNIWPGFVDALASLLLVIIFLLMIFVLAQFFLSEALSGRDNTLDKLRGQVVELADLLALERKAQDNMKTNLAQLSEELQTSVMLRDDLRSTLNSLQVKSEEVKARLTEELIVAQSAGAESERKLETQLNEIAGLNRNISALRALRDELQSKVVDLAEKSGRDLRALESGKKALIAERKISESARAEMALLNKQMATLRQQLVTIERALEISENLSAEKNVQIVTLGKRLNAAMATKVAELSRYRSEFFGRLRTVLGRQQGLRVSGDRFVFQSEVLFDKASAIIGTAGQTQLTALGATLREVAAKIPNDIDWVLRVDGHTDNDPIKTLRFPSNWELSSARAIAVVQHLINNGLPPNRLVAAGFGRFHPMDPGRDEIAKRRNRRIELKLTQR
ncbi:MAG: hypothetical protein CBB68_10065 [Rhodospirillaceae bacterium TMED8]|nr:hypothetical protein [Magnetovibrio sp.]OUT50198.1 MAG: hypothetical protein CBB68_10065 [Rhodospirillaceae bacterium TMED8]